MTDYLSLLNALDENERLEAKRGSEIGPSILETICAFANEPGLQGGTLLLGVVRDESDLFSPYVVEGVAQPDALGADLATQCREKFNVPVRAQMANEQISGRAILVVTVPEAQPGPTLRLLGSDEGAPALSSGPGGLSSNPEGLSSNPNWQELPPELQELVAGLGQRATPDKLREAVIRLCRDRPWQAYELAGLFGRNPVYLGTQYLRPLVNAGVLAYRMPDQPNHPHQAYRAVDGTDETA